MAKHCEVAADDEQVKQLFVDELQFWARDMKPKSHRFARTGRARTYRHRDRNLFRLRDTGNQRHPAFSTPLGLGGPYIRIHRADPLNGRLGAPETSGDQRESGAAIQGSKGHTAVVL